MSERYAAWQSAIEDDPRAAYVERLLALLPTAPMFFAGHDEARNEQLVRDAGLTVVESRTEQMHEPESEPGTGPATASFHWMIAQKSAD